MNHIIRMAPATAGALVLLLTVLFATGGDLGFVSSAHAQAYLQNPLKISQQNKGWRPNTDYCQDSSVVTVYASGMAAYDRMKWCREFTSPSLEMFLTYVSCSETACDFGGTELCGGVYCGPFGTGAHVVTAPGVNGETGFCCTANPINAGTGNKYQIETDYAGAGPLALQFSRQYNSLSYTRLDNLHSSGKRWRHNFDRKLTVSAYAGIQSVNAFRPNDRVVPFYLDSGIWKTTPDVSDRLFEILSGTTRTGWTYVTADAEQTETYDLSGRLLSIANRAGLTLTLAYGSGGSTGPNGAVVWDVSSGTPVATSTALRAGMLIRVTDSFGRTLVFNYDSGLRMIRMIDPDAREYLYAFNTSTRNLTSVKYPDATTRTYHYENATFPSALTGITDENNARFSTYGYDASGRATLSEHAGGNERVTVSYTSPSVATVTDALGRARAYSLLFPQDIAKSGGSDQPCDHCGTFNVASQSFDVNGNAASRIDFSGNRTNYTYDLTRNLETSRTEGLNSGGGVTPQTRTITTAWHASYRLPTQIAEPLRITTNVYGDPTDPNPGNRGSLLSKTVQATADADGSQGFSATLAGTPRTWTYTYNSNGQVLSIDGPRTDVSDVTTYTYDAQGNVASIANAAGHSTSITSYNAHGRPLTIADPNGLTTTLTYDARQRLNSRTVAGENTSYDYDGVGQLTKVTLPDGSFISYSYDSAHRLTGMQDNAGNSISYALDAMGNRTLEQVRDPASQLAQTRSRVYSNLNRLFRELGAQNQTIEYAYDNQGNVLSVKDPLNRVTSQQYDALNRLQQVTDPANGITQYAYNGLDALTQVTDPRNLSTGYSVDGLGNLTLQSSPDTGTTANTYDVAGNLLTQTDAKSQVTSYAYDALSRVTLITFHDGSKQSYAYDQGANGIGRLSSITETNLANQVTSVIAYAYSPHGRVTSETRTVGAVQYATAYSYDASGRMSGMTYPSGRSIAYSFDSLGRIGAVTTTKSGQTQQVVSAVAYHPFGGVKSYSLGNGQAYTRAYDQDGRIASYTLGTSNFAIGYDAASRIEFISDVATPANSNTYGYDNLDRLTQAVTPSTPFGYSYDAVGNRLSKTVGAGTESYSYSSTSNHIASLTPTSGPARSFAFDANGSTTADGVNTYAYDVRGRMTQATSVIGTTSYQVNALGQRIRKTSTQGDTVFHYDTRGRLIAETDPGGALKREILYLGDIPVGVVQ